MGHSFDGGITLSLAAKNNKISKLVLIDSAGISPSYSMAKMFFLLIKKTCRGFVENKAMTFLMMKDFISASFRNLFFSVRIYKTIKNSMFSDYDAFGLIAYDTQELKEIGGCEENNLSLNKENAAIMGAFKLYLDFVNLFLFFLRFFGVSRD